MVCSRAFSLEFGWEMQRTISLVPFIDLANHRSPLRTRERANSLADPVRMSSEPGKEECVLLVAPHDLRAGEEVCIPYRSDGGGTLLLDYGFSEEPSPPGSASAERLSLSALEDVLRAENAERAAALVRAGALGNHAQLPVLLGSEEAP